MEIILKKITEYIIPTIILVVFIEGIREKKDVFKLFIEGVKNGIESTFKLIPIIIAFFFFSGIITSSNFISVLFDKFLNITGNIKYVITTFVIKCFSGSAGISMGIETLNKVGVDSNLGLALSVILGATETTLYVASIYLGNLKNKKIYPIIILGLLCDIFVLIVSMAIFIDFV